MISKRNKRLAFIGLRVNLGDIAKILKVFSQMLIIQIANLTNVQLGRWHGRGWISRFWAWNGPFRLEYASGHLGDDYNEVKEVANTYLVGAIWHDLVNGLALRISDKGEPLGEACSRVSRYYTVNDLTKLRKVRFYHFFFGLIS